MRRWYFSPVLVKYDRISCYNLADKYLVFKGVYNFMLKHTHAPSTEISWIAKRRMMVQIIPRVIFTLPSTISVNTQIHEWNTDNLKEQDSQLQTLIYRLMSLHFLQLEKSEVKIFWTRVRPSCAGTFLTILESVARRISCQSELKSN